MSRRVLGGRVHFFEEPELIRKRRALGAGIELCNPEKSECA